MPGSLEEEATKTRGFDLGVDPLLRAAPQGLSFDHKK